LSARLHFVVEGQTEETFVNKVLAPHLATHSVWTDARCVMTGRRRGITYRGGLQSYIKVKRDITLWMKEDHNQDSFFTTMFDLYALPSDFPLFQDAQGITDPRRRVALLEEGMRQDIIYARFVPYIQLHEFETLILADPQKLDWEYIEHAAGIKHLTEMAAGFDSPEMINDGDDTAPSKRIIKEIPEYDGMKISAGPIVTQKIGLATLRAKCQHFCEWLLTLERLGGSA
jgi:hypothetical protein